MEQYYKQRAPYYDRVYDYPERAADITFLKEYIPLVLEGLNIVEIAAGTGFWTQFIAVSARSVLATDLVQETLNELTKRELPDSVTAMTADAFKLEELDRKFDGAFVGLWLSHVNIEKANDFFRSLHSVLHPGAKVVILDNTKAQCERIPIIRTDEIGNTYQSRELDDGSSYEVLKNFPGEESLLEYVALFGENPKFIELEHLWLFEYESKAH